MKKVFIPIITVLIFIACGNNQSLNNESLSGNIINLAEDTPIYLDYLTPNKIVTKDTAIIDGNGNYQFDVKIDQLGYYRLRINNQNFVNLILDINETPIINGDGNNLMDTYSVEGSNQSQLLKEFNLVIKEDYIFQDSLNRYYQAYKNDPQVFIDVTQKSMASENQLKTYFTELINANPSSLVALAAVQQLDAEQNFELYKKVDENIAKTLANTPYYEPFHEKVEQLSKLNTGGEAPDIAVADKDGNPIKLSDLRGNVVLLDFWASWCRPCRAENPNVVKAYNKYHDKGFEVFSVSLDGMPQQGNPKQDWLNAIEKDGLLWKSHGSELKGWQSSFIPVYGIQGIPFTVLIDKDGKIIGKNLRGPALEGKLAEIFG